VKWRNLNIERMQMRISDVTELINEHIAETVRIQFVLRQTLINTDIPLEDRWKLFTHATRFNFYRKRDSYVPSFKSISDDDIHDAFCEQRYMTISMERLLERLDLSEVDELKLKEEILQKGITEFVYDW